MGKKRSQLSSIVPKPASAPGTIEGLLSPLLGAKGVVCIASSLNSPEDSEPRSGTRISGVVMSSCTVVSEVKTQ